MNQTNQSEPVEVKLTGGHCRQRIVLSHIENGKAGLAGLVDDESQGHFWSAIEPRDKPGLLERIGDPATRNFIALLLR
jgi:hypothetical protein